MPKMMRGSNQYRSRFLAKWQKTAVQGVFILAFIFVFFYSFSSRIVTAEVRPLPKKAIVYLTPAPDNSPTIENITAYISKTFALEGKTIVKRALDISFCESSWNDKAYNFNKNRTSDYNIFQINSIHIKKYGDGFMHDWQENVRTAYKIYKTSGFKPWVCDRKT